MNHVKKVGFGNLTSQHLVKIDKIGYVSNALMILYILKLIINDKIMMKLLKM